MLKTPVLERPTAEATLVEPTKATLVAPTEATLVAPTEANDVMTMQDTLDAKATSLRRAATALLLFSIICARPCPSSWGAWLGMIAAISVLCASGKKLLCRSRSARFLSFFVAIFAGYTVVSLIISYRAGMPKQMSEKFVLESCMEMPADTFVWARSKLVEHHGFRKGLSFLSCHMDEDIAVLVSNASSHLVGATDPATQPEACDKLAHTATCFAKMTMIASALAHLALVFAAVAVVKRACCLRFAAYRAGLLTWKCCKGKCARTEKANVTPPPTAAKEMA